MKPLAIALGAVVLLAGCLIEEAPPEIGDPIAPAAARENPQPVATAQAEPAPATPAPAPTPAPSPAPEPAASEPAPSDPAPQPPADAAPETNDTNADAKLNATPPAPPTPPPPAAPTTKKLARNFTLTLSTASTSGVPLIGGGGGGGQSNANNMNCVRFDTEAPIAIVAGVAMATWDDDGVTETTLVLFYDPGPNATNLRAEGTSPIQIAINASAVDTKELPRVFVRPSQFKAAVEQEVMLVLELEYTGPDLDFEQTTCSGN